MIQQGNVGAFWPWVVSAGLHTVGFAALWGATIATPSAGFDTAPLLSGRTVAAAAHRASSLGDITDGEGQVCFEATMSSAKQAVHVRLVPPKAPQPANDPRPTERPHATTDTEHTVASHHAAKVERQQASLPSRAMGPSTIAEKPAANAVVPHVPSRARSTVAQRPQTETPSAAASHLTGQMAAVSVLKMAQVMVQPAEIEQSDGGRFIRRGGRWGREGSVGDGNSSPEPLANRPPVYPEVARRNNWAGTVVLRLWISDQGHVEHVEVATSSGHEVLDASATAAVSDWQFRPAQRGGEGVAVTVLLPVVYDLHRDSHVSVHSTSMSK